MRRTLAEPVRAASVSGLPLIRQRRKFPGEQKPVKPVNRCGCIVEVRYMPHAHHALACRPTWESFDDLQFRVRYMH